jgi:hypothetical protein
VEALLKLYPNPADAPKDGVSWTLNMRRRVGRRAVREFPACKPCTSITWLAERQFKGKLGHSIKIG